MKGIPRSLQSNGEKSVLPIDCLRAARNKLQTLSSCKHWSALACVGVMSCFVSRTRCAVEQDFGRTLVYVCCRNHRLNCHDATHTLHVHWKKKQFS